MQAGLERLDEVVVGGRVALEDHHRGDVHVGGPAVLDVEEGGVERGQAIRVSCHRPGSCL
jgi:hypothetical protein